MAKLPANLVKAPLFDSPLRSTARVVPSKDPKIETPAVSQPTMKTEQARLAVVSEVVQPAEKKRTSKKQKSQPQKTLREDEIELTHRCTIRLTKDQHLGLEKRVYERLLLGEKTNAAALLREILDNALRK